MSETRPKVNSDDVVVSVIVLTYNHVNYIRQTLDSVLAQKVDFRYEVLIGDDASTDGTSDIVWEYAKKHPQIIRAFVREKNMGATNNLYDLFLRTRGTYIASCEGDDFWTDPRKLQLQVNWLANHPEYVGCYHRCYVVDEMGISAPKPKWIGEKKVFRLQDFGGIILPGHMSTWLYRNIFLEPAHDYSIIPNAHPVIGDRTMAMILLSQGDFGIIDRSMSCYRSITKKGKNNATSQVFVKQDDSKFIEYKLTYILECYANEEMKVHANFSSFRQKLFLKALVKLVMKPCNSRWECIRNIVHLASQNHYE